MTGISTPMQPTEPEFLSTVELEWMRSEISRRLGERLDRVPSAPGLFTFIGIGATLYGQSYFDPVSTTYVTTHWLVFLGAPVFPINRFRVLAVPRSSTSVAPFYYSGGVGYYFIGVAPRRPKDFFVAGVTWLAGLIILWIAR
jgi:hypothetical protein